MAGKRKKGWTRSLFTFFFRSLLNLLNAVIWEMMWKKGHSNCFGWKKMKKKKMERAMVVNNMIQFHLVEQHIVLRTQQTESSLSKLSTYLTN